MSLLRKTISELKATNQLKEINQEVSADLELATAQLIAYETNQPALLFNNISGSKYPVVTNLFGSVNRGKFLFRKEWDNVSRIIRLKSSPLDMLKHPLRHSSLLKPLYNALPRKVKWDPNAFENITISDLPQIKCWPEDGGAFITLPQVYTEDPEKPGIALSNLGMYRIQLSGNSYIINQEVGLHYQIHRGIGVHQSKAKQKGEKLKVSIFIGGHPAHTLAAIMPLPDGMSEINFAGLLAGKRFTYAYDENGHCISMDADFVITGYLDDTVKPEGPFGDHLGYYSWVHDFPVLKVLKVYAKKDAVWPFTVVGRPPQEDTTFGALIHELTGEAVKNELPGIKEVNAVDAAGVHPLLLAIGSERYTPYLKTDFPAEILTQANKILGTGQLSLAKYLFITAPYNENDRISTKDIPDFLEYILERVDLKRDLHFQTFTNMDTLDYSGGTINKGSKMIVAAHGPKLRNLSNQIPDEWQALKPQIISKGILAISYNAFTDYQKAKSDIDDITSIIKRIDAAIYEQFPMIVLVDDSVFTATSYNNFLWVTFTRSNPAHDVYGVDAFFSNKHWCSNGPMIIDARLKPFMMPVLRMPDNIYHKMQELFK